MTSQSSVASAFTVAEKQGGQRARNSSTIPGRYTRAHAMEEALDGWLNKPGKRDGIRDNSQHRQMLQRLVMAFGKLAAVTISIAVSRKLAAVSSPSPALICCT